MASGNAAAACLRPPHGSPRLRPAWPCRPRRLPPSRHPLPKPQLQIEGRNEWLWLEQDLIDIAYNMDYNWRPSFYKFDEARATSVARTRMVLMLGNHDNDATGKVVSRTLEQVARLVDCALRKYPDNGVALYWYGSLDDAQIEALRTGPFKETAVPSWTVGR